MRHVKVDPVSDFFLNKIPLPDASPVGREYAVAVVQEFKASFSGWDTGLVPYLLAWNQRGGNPFTREEIAILAETPKLAKPKRRPKPEPSCFAVGLFGEDGTKP